VLACAAKLAVSLTVAVHPFKKPFVYKGFDNLNTDGHGLTRIRKTSLSLLTSAATGGGTFGKRCPHFSL
jgi:hypothetical protein